MSYQIGNKIVCEVGIPDVPCVGEGYTICKPLQIQNCSDCGDLIVNNGLLLCDCGDSWNCNLCTNDRPYYNPVNDNDSIFFQFQQFDVLNGDNPEQPGVNGWGTASAKFQIFSCCGESQLNYSKTVVLNDYVGLFETQDYKGNSTYQNIQFQISNRSRRILFGTLQIKFMQEKNGFN